MVSSAACTSPVVATSSSLAAARIAIALLASAPFSAACALDGDFGRTQFPPGIEAPLIQPAIPDRRGEVVASAFPLTDEEKELRALARNLLMPPHGDIVGPDWPSFSFAYVPREALVNDYAGFIVGGPFRSASARYARVIDDLRNDLTRMGPFFRVARRVADLDGKRERSLGFVAQLSPDEIANARRRVRENITVMADVRELLLARAAAYRFALERLVIAVPSPAAVEAERLCAELDRRAREIEIVAQLPGGRPPPY